eukprot:2751315-Rhodomonas_salina.3
MRRVRIITLTKHVYDDIADSTLHVWADRLENPILRANGDVGFTACLSDAEEHRARGTCERQTSVMKWVPQDHTQWLPHHMRRMIWRVP